MNGLESLAASIGELANKLPEIRDQSFEENKGEYLDIQKDQLFHGVTSTGGTFRKYKSSAYAKKKNSMNELPGYGNPDLKLTGAFYRGFFAKVQNGTLTIGSTDSKSQLLESEYKDVFGLNPVEMSDFLDGKIQPTLIKNILSQLTVK